MSLFSVREVESLRRAVKFWQRVVGRKPPADVCRDVEEGFRLIKALRWYAATYECNRQSDGSLLLPPIPELSRWFKHKSAMSPLTCHDWWMALEFSGMERDNGIFRRMSAPVDPENDEVLS